MSRDLFFDVFDNICHAFVSCKKRKKYICQSDDVIEVFSNSEPFAQLDGRHFFVNENFKENI